MRAFGSTGFGGSVFGERDAFDLWHRLAVVELHFEFFRHRHRRTSIGVDDSGVAGLGLGSGARLAGARPVWPSLATRRVTVPTVSSSPCFNDLLARDASCR